MCDQRERLIEYLFDECDPAVRREVQAHLDACESCRHEVAGLRRVRSDLLAWDVPQRGSVWQPFAPPRSVPWYREVPAWAMTAAASLLFLVGAAGGVVTHAVMPESAFVEASIAPVQTPSVRPADLADAEARIVTKLRSEVGAQLRNAAVQPVSLQPVVMRASHELPEIEDRLFRRARAIVAASEDRQDEMVRTVNSDLINMQRTIDLLEREVTYLRSLLEASR